MNEILDALQHALDDIDSIDLLLAAEINEDSAELRSAVLAAVANLSRARQAAAVLRDHRSGLVTPPAVVPARSAIDDGD